MDGSFQKNAFRREIWAPDRGGRQTPRTHISGTEARSAGGVDVRVEAQTYLTSKGKNNSRSPSGMTTNGATAKARTDNRGNKLFSVLMVGFVVVRNEDGLASLDTPD
jgi:hypothetical protein